MKIGLLLPSLAMSISGKDQIFAPGKLYLALAFELAKRGNQVFAYTASPIQEIIPEGEFGDVNLEEIKFVSVEDQFKGNNDGRVAIVSLGYEYELDLTRRAYLHGQKVKLDVMHSYSYFAAHYFADFVDFPTLFTVHDPVFPKNTIENYKYRQFNHHNYNFLSKRQEDLYKMEYCFSKTRVIANSIATLNKAQTFKREGCFFAGRMIKEKGFSEALKATSETESVLNFATSDLEKDTDYFKSCLELIDRRLHYDLGYLNSSEVSLNMAKAKMTIFPSTFEESFGLVVGESMAVGTPVVAYATGATPEIIEDGITGLLINKNDEDIRGKWVTKETGVLGLVSAVRYINSMSDHDYSLMSKRAQDRVCERYNISKIASNYIDLYESLSKSVNCNVELKEYVPYSQNSL